MQQQTLISMHVSWRKWFVCGRALHALLVQSAPSPTSRFAYGFGALAALAVHIVEEHGVMNAMICPLCAVLNSVRRCTVQHKSPELLVCWASRPTKCEVLGITHHSRCSCCRSTSIVVAVLVTSCNTGGSPHPECGDFPCNAV